MHNDFITSIAYHQPTKTVKHVKEVENGLNCECTCEECGGRLEAIQSKSNRRWYFRHHTKSGCGGWYETLLHRYAKQVIVYSRSIVRKKNDSIVYTNAFSEKSVDPYRPDVTIDLENGEQVYIEIFVSNKVKEIKKEYFIKNQLKSFEINLSKVSARNNLVDLDELKNEILENHRNRVLIFWPEETKGEESSNWFWPLIVGTLFFIFGIFTFRSLRKRKKRK